MKFKLRFRKSTRVTAGVLAGACFIALAIHSWGLPLKTALLFLLISLTFLVLIVGLAAIVAYIIRLARNSSNDS